MKSPAAARRSTGRRDRGTGRARRRRRTRRERGRRRSGRRARRRGRRGRRWPRPRPAAAATSRCPRSSSTAPRSPNSSRHGWTRAPAGARPSTTRSGSRPATWRTVRAGSSTTHGAGADEHGVALGPQPVGVGPGLLAGDPLARAVGRGGAAVDGGGELEHDVRAAGAAMGQVRGELGRDGVGLDPDGDVDARRRAGRRHPARRQGVGVLDADDDTADAGGDDRVGARRRAPVVVARFERGHERGPGRRPHRRRRSASRSAWGPPGGCVAPVAMTARRRRRRRHRPTGSARWWCGPQRQPRWLPACCGGVHRRLRN